MRSSMKLKQIPNSYSSKTQCGADSKKSKGKYEKNMDNNEGREKEQTQKKDSKESLVVKQSLIVVLIQASDFNCLVLLALHHRGPASLGSDIIHKVRGETIRLKHSLTSEGRHTYIEMNE
ncbi:hypothetical protein RRG08_048006 [Elysia crispata]|uniref:Uncharacterized protein n=1 Tax=Elysia crispata TaxID=231223 RepID=A0AAE0XT31_9GAST|nr:hypothetical protein RRG08_048006 [Elysia crispata]